MSTKTKEQIAEMNSSVLLKMIDEWDYEYDAITILYAYIELTNRNHPIPENIKTRLQQFCNSHKQPDIETYIKSALNPSAITDNNSENEIERYSGLKSIMGLITFTGYLVIIIGVGLLLFFASNGQVLNGAISLVVSLLTALPLLVYSNLIYVFIDTERNTRKTLEAITKLKK